MTQLGAAYARKHWAGARILPYIESELAKLAGSDDAKAAGKSKEGGEASECGEVVV
jgi:hypothetical protein